MSRRNQKYVQRDIVKEEIPTEGSRFLSAGAVRAATLAGVVVLIFLGYMNWAQTRQINKSLNDFDARLTQLAAKVDQGVNKAAPPARQQGPDPNRVYTVKTDGAPFKGPKNASITIVEFSEFQ